MEYPTFPKALGHTVLGVVWRLTVFALVVLCFYTLMDLRKWYTRYAPSAEWASAAEDKKLDWSDELAGAARTMATARPVATYPSSDAFYKALLRSIQNTPTSSPDLQRYQKDLVARSALETSLLERIDSPDALDQNSKQLTQVMGRIADLEEKREGLQVLETRDDDQEKSLQQVEDQLAKERKRMLSLQEQVQGLTNGRVSIEAGFQKKLTVVSSRINKVEEGIKEAFDAVAVPARPVQRLSSLGPLALQIGNESDPLHVIYLIAWYGLETVIVLLLCAIVAPWLIRLFGDTSDPKEVQSKVTEQIKALLSAAFSRTTVAALAVVAVGGAAAAGVALAAGDQPPILPTIRHDGAAVAGVKGDPGEPGQPGTDGLDGEDGECGPWSTSGLTDLLSRLEQQALDIEALKTRLADTEAKANQSIRDVLDLNQKVAIASGNVGNLTSVVASLNRDMSDLSGSIGGLYAANQSILRLSDTNRQQVLGALTRLENDAVLRRSQIDALQKTVDTAAASVSPAASDVLWMNAVPDGAWTRISPFHRYQVTPQVTAALERAMGGIDPGQKALILAALQRLGKTEMRVGDFKTRLRKNCAEDARDTLESWIPLIVKLSRVKEEHHG